MAIMTPMGRSDRTGVATDLRTCCVCGHTEDHETAAERWAHRPVADQWMCDECWHDDEDFPEVGDERK